MNPKYPFTRNNSLGPYINSFKTLRIRSLKSIVPQTNQLTTKRPPTRLNSPIKNKNKENYKNDELVINGIDSSSIHFSYSPSSCKKQQIQKQTFNRKLKQPQKFNKKTKELCSIYLERPKSRINILFSSQFNQQIMRIR